MWKKNNDKALNDRNLIEECEKAMETLIILGESDENLVSNLRVLKEKIKYLVPSNEEKIYEFDRRIKNLIEDMRIALVKADRESMKKTKQILADLRIAIVDRNSRI